MIVDNQKVWTNCWYFSYLTRRRRIDNSFYQRKRELCTSITNCCSSTTPPTTTTIIISQFYKSSLNFSQQQQQLKHQKHHQQYRTLSSIRLYDSLSGKIIPLSNHLQNDFVKSNNKLVDESLHDQSNLQNNQTILQDRNNQQQQNQQQQQIGLACYTCGPTTYAPAHLGHARTYVTLDILRRCIEATSTIPPIFVMNITDVDDKILQAAAAVSVTTSESTSTSSTVNTTTNPIDLARTFEAQFWYDMDCLNVLRPHYITRVTEHVESDIIPYIQKIIDNKMAYEIKECTSTSTDNDYSDNDFPGVYFDVQAYEKQQSLSSTMSSKYDKFSSIGKVNTNDIDSKPEVTTTGTTIGPVTDEATSSTSSTRTKKRDVRDFALWKIRKPNEVLYWSSQFGNGRPGWHIECSAMIEAVQKQLQTISVINTTNNNKNTNSFNNNSNNTIKYKFVLHCGGIDLQFPHHTNEIAQANAYHCNHSHNNTTNDSNGNNNNIVCDTLHGNKTNNNDEWIPHWVHTGHLHIHGMKMSKSLKNFITIQEMLSNTTNNDVINDNEIISTSIPPQQQITTTTTTTVFHSPADDFRLWCLGLSGSYRSTATFSDDRRTEASQIRQQIVRFLIDGEELVTTTNTAALIKQQSVTISSPLHNQHPIDKQQNYLPTKKWKTNDHELVMLANTVSIQCRDALFNNDLDGSTFVEKLMQLVTYANRYIRRENNDVSPIEPLIHTLKIVRDLLILVGFSDMTCRAGLVTVNGNISTNSSDSIVQNNAVGGERAILNEFVRFRSSIRDIVIAAIKEQKGDTVSSQQQDVVSTLLRLCDDVRDRTLPAIGVELKDGRVDDNVNNENDTIMITSPGTNTSSTAYNSGWRYCVPRSSSLSLTHKIVTQNNVNMIDFASVSPLEYFRIGQYEGQFSEYDPDGIPTMNIDGSSVSIRQMKKYRKKLEKHMARYDSQQTSET